MVRPQRPAEYEKTAELEALRRELLAEGKDPVTGDNTAAPVEDRPQFSKFSTHRGEAPGGISREQAQQAIDEFRAGLSASTGLDFQRSDTLEDALGANHGIEGTVKAYLLPRTGTVVLIRRSLDSVYDAIQTLRHEVLAHYGLNLFEPDVKADILLRIVHSRGLPAFRGLFREVEREYPNLKNDEFRIAEEEFFAKIAAAAGAR